MACNNSFEPIDPTVTATVLSLPMATFEVPYEVRLDPDSARRLATEGCTLLLLDVPPGTLIGIDHQVKHLAAPLQGHAP